jgi:hypothetical protein
MTESAEWRDIDLKIFLGVESGPANVTECKNKEFWETKMATER